jgi:ABC transporter, ATP-binding protein
MTSAEGSKTIQVKGLCKEFENKVVLKDINATFTSGNVSCIIGRSGAGKTVMLKCLIGLIEPTSGEILFDGQDLVRLSKDQLKRLRQMTGVLFQSSALFDSMTVLENVLFPLQLFSKHSPKERKAHAIALLERVGLEGSQEKFPAEISGGMMKRVAIARAVALNPHYLFCDEPNSGLDPTTSASIDTLIESLTKEYQITTVINTHDMNSIRTIADHILYLDRGAVAWQGSREELDDNIPISLRNFLYL